jgi:DDE superfamily endonuclease
MDWEERWIFLQDTFAIKERKADPISALGVVLAWYRFRGAEYVLQGWFGFTGAHANVWLRFGRRMLLRGLLQNELAKVSFSSDEMIAKYQQIIGMRHENLPDVYCTADGCKIYFQQDKSLDIQSMFYKRWLKAHFISNLFVFGADGRIIACVVNAPGSIHDSTLAFWGGIYAKLEEVYNRTGAVCCVDSAFASNPNPYLIRSAQDLTEARDAREMVRFREATSLRQASEWGMRAIQGAFPRLHDKIKLEYNGERSRILRLVPLLYNFRLEAVGLNQIRNVYVINWSKDSDYYIRELPT